MLKSSSYLGVVAMAALCACSSSTKSIDEPLGDRVNIEVHNTGTRTIVVTVHSGNETSLDETLAAGELLADDYDGAVGEAVSITVTAAAGGGAPAASGSKTCTPKSTIINTSTYGHINVAAGTGTTIQITCAASAHWTGGVD